VLDENNRPQYAITFVYLREEVVYPFIILLVALAGTALYLVLWKREKKKKYERS